MKKVISFLILFFLPIFVFADTGQPIYAGYNAYVSNKNGAYLYTFNDNKELEITDIKLKYNKKVYITDEIEVVKGIFFGEVDYDCGDDECEETYYINLDRIKKNNEDKVYSPSELNSEIKKRFGAGNVGNLDMISKPAIITKENSTIYNYPSFTANKLSYKPEMYEEFTLVTIITNYQMSTGWFYIKNDNIEGWISSNEGLAYNMKGSFVFKEETPTYTNKKSDTKSDYIIPANTTLSGNNVFQLYLYGIENTSKDDYLIVKDNDSYYWVTDYFLNNKDALDKKDIIGEEEEDDSTFDVICLVDTPYYEQIGETTIGKIPANTELEVKNYYDKYNEDKGTSVEYYYITYNGKDYWVKESDVSDDVMIDYSHIFFTEKTKYYERIDGDSKGTISEGTIKDIKMCVEKYNSKTDKDEKYYRIEQNNKNYWIKESDKQVYFGDGIYAKNQAMMTKDTDIYDKLGGKVVGKIPKGEIVQYLITNNISTDEANPKYVYSSEEYLYVRYNEKLYWIKTSDVMKANYNTSVYISDSYEYYDEINGTKVDIEIRNKKPYSYYYVKEDENDWYYLDGYKVWVKKSNVIEKESEELDDEKDEPVVIAVENGISNKTKIIISIFSSVIIAVSAVVSIILINKMRKAKEVDK